MELFGFSSGSQWWQKQNKGLSIRDHLSILALAHELQCHHVNQITNGSCQKYYQKYYQTAMASAMKRVCSKNKVGYTTQILCGNGLWLYIYGKIQRTGTELISFVTSNCSHRVTRDV